jgi:hypothetical protein
MVPTFNFLFLPVSVKKEARTVFWRQVCLPPGAELVLLCVLFNKAKKMAVHEMW